MFNSSQISFSQTNLLPLIVSDLLEAGELNFNKNTDRKLLVSKLQEQYQSLQVDEKVKTNISSLGDEKTFTVTTGHQLCLFGGPAYFIYKIVSAIKACELYALHNPDKKFVPVFWLASEDHDFEEVNHLYLFNKKIQWNKEGKGAVGRLNTEGLAEVLNEVKALVGESEVTKIFEESLAATSLSAMTRYWVNALFGKYGLVIIDADDKDLKRSFSSVIEKEFKEKVGKSEVEKTNAILGEKYKLQVNPRDINFFLMEDGKRERFTEANTDWQKILQEHPEKFSPNVIYRPLYQEYILPNVAYVGGPNELAYWFQLKGVFTANDLVFPQLVLRDSFLLINAQQQKLMNALSLSVEDIFKSTDQLKAQYISGKEEWNMAQYSNDFSNVFSSLKEEVNKIDASLEGMVDAEKARLFKQLENLSSKIMKAQKLRYEIDLNKIEKLKNQLFSGGVFQERKVNFMEFYVHYNEQYFEQLFLSSNPFNSCLKVLSDL